MSPAISDPIQQRLYRTGILAVLIIDRAEEAVPLARALLAGGVDCIELTLRTEVALEAIRRVRAQVPEMLIGAGTLLTPQQTAEARAAGANFGVAPGTNARVVAEAQLRNWPFFPGVCTPTDIELALEAGCRLLKFFPSEPSGGLAYLRVVAAPFMHLGVRFIPLGGIGPTNARQYLEEPSVLALGGSWLAPRELVAAQDWPAITQLARDARAIVRHVRP